MNRIALFAILLATAVAPAAEPILIAKPEAFKTLVNPSCSHCVDEAKRRKDELKESDPVLCWTRGYSEGGAIPLRFFLNSYRVISDSYGVFVYDPDAGYARGFAPSYNFEFHGWRNGVMVMKDKTDDTIYSCLSGVAVEGKRKGDKLKPIPTLVSTWGEVMKRNPNAVAYQMFERYKPVELADKGNEDSIKSRMAKVDPRLKADDLVLGVKIGGKTRAYKLSDLKEGVSESQRLDNTEFQILRRSESVAAYQPDCLQARKWKAPNPDKSGVSPVDQGVPLPDGEERKPSYVRLSNSNGDINGDEMKWGIDGRALDGALKGWTLEPVEYVVCKWFAWNAEYPDTEVFGEKKTAVPLPVIDKNTKPISGMSEFLRLLPKPFGVLQDFDAKARTVTLLLDGEKTAKRWNLEPDAEVYFNGYWGRLEQFQKNDKVWVWLKLDKHKNPIAVAMIADELSSQLLRHNPEKKDTAPLPAEALSKEAAQRTWLRKQWRDEGLPGTLTFNHVFSGELEVMLDHEAMRWGRSLKAGDSVELLADGGIKAVVKTVTPWRERTQLRLVVGELQTSELKLGMRLNVKVAAPAKEIDESPYPSDIDRVRTEAERIEWFLCSIYCVCPVGKDTCTGHFYTLASCNPNGCGAPEFTRDEIRKFIAAKKTDREIWDALLKDRGPWMTRPHLKP